MHKTECWRSWTKIKPWSEESKYHRCTLCHCATQAPRDSFPKSAQVSPNSLGVLPWNSIITQPENLGICLNIPIIVSFPTPLRPLSCSVPTLVALSISPLHCCQEEDIFSPRLSQPVVGEDSCNKMKTNKFFAACGPVHRALGSGLRRTSLDGNSKNLLPGWSCNSMVEWLPGMCKDLGFIPYTGKERRGLGWLLRTLII